jgi:hypothetical protein
MGHVTYLEILELHEEINMLLLTFHQGKSQILCNLLRRFNEGDLAPRHEGGN